LVILDDDDQREGRGNKGSEAKIHIKSGLAHAIATGSSSGQRGGKKRGWRKKKKEEEEERGRREGFSERPPPCLVIRFARRVLLRVARLAPSPSSSH
jgi:hypothetical protein